MNYIYKCCMFLNFAKSGWQKRIRQTKQTDFFYVELCQVVCENYCSTDRPNVTQGRSLVTWKQNASIAPCNVFLELFVFDTHSEISLACAIFFIIYGPMTCLEKEHLVFDISIKLVVLTTSN